MGSDVIDDVAMGNSQSSRSFVKYTNHGSKEKYEGNESFPSCYSKLNFVDRNLNHSQTPTQLKHKL